VTDFFDNRDLEAQQYADRHLTREDWLLPSLVISCYRGYLRPDEANAEFRRAHENRITLRYAPGGPMNFCFDNATRAVASAGGKVVLGWQIMPHMLWPEGVHMEAHAVWESPEGEVIEVTAGRPTWQFAPSSRVRMGDQIVITSASNEHARTLKRNAKALFRGPSWVVSRNRMND